jgi:hypothetical protein
MHRMHQIGLWPVLFNIFPTGITKLKTTMRTTNQWKGWNSCIRFSGERVEAIGGSLSHAAGAWTTQHNGTQERAGW